MRSVEENAAEDTFPLVECIGGGRPGKVHEADPAQVLDKYREATKSGHRGWQGQPTRIGTAPTLLAVDAADIDAIHEHHSPIPEP
mmetsp:Transcript_15245/g.42503  ORF Transcript_15245/g.42503 Transcript_15245/m.42503 type:complete len:85 (-) Transcript_15245:1560-1814(-)